MRFVSPVAVVLSLLLVCGLGCHGEPDAERYDVGVRTLTLVDSTRETPACLAYPGSGERRLVTEVYYPIERRADRIEDATRDAPADRSGAPYPFVTWSHGFMGTRARTTYLTHELARRGYVVASPDFPLTSLGSPCIAWPGDGSSQGLDVRFLNDSLIALSRDPDSFLAGMVDEDRIGATGYSFGGFTSILAGFSPDLGDPRIKVVLALAPFACAFDEDLFAKRSVPLMIIGGDRDGLAVFDSNQDRPYRLAPSPKYLVRLHGGNHAGFAGLEDVTAEPKTGAILRLLGIDPANLGAIGPEDLPPGVARELGVSFFDMVEEIEGTMDGCDLSLFGPFISTTPDARRQCDLALLFGTTFLDRYLKGIPDRAGAMTPEFAATAAGTPELPVTLERELGE